LPPPHHHRPRAPPCTGYVHYPNHRPPPLPILLLFLLHCWISMQQIHSDVGQGRDQRGGNVHLFVWVQMSPDFCACQRLYLASMVAASINLCLIWPPPTANKQHRSLLLSLSRHHSHTSTKSGYSPGWDRFSPNFPTRTIGSGTKGYGPSGSARLKKIMGKAPQPCDLWDSIPKPRALPHA
jgi:hypothetical protein